MTFLVLRKALSTRNTSSRTTKSPTHQIGANPPKKNIHRHSSKSVISSCRHVLPSQCQKCMHAERMTSDACLGAMTGPTYLTRTIQLTQSQCP